MSEVEAPTQPVGDFVQTFRAFLEGMAGFCQTKCRHYRKANYKPQCDPPNPGCPLRRFQMIALEKDAKERVLKKIRNYAKK